MSKQKKANDGGEAPILIKKYANRRLYHTQKSSYVTLDDLSLMVREGEDFVVQDAKTGEDITRTILTQIIFDAENSGQMMLPTSFLREIIRLYGDTMQSFVPSYLEQAMGIFTAQQEHFREEFEKSMPQNPALMGFEQLSKMNKEWIERSMQMFGAFRPGASQTTKGNQSERETELDEMKTQLKDMQDKLSKLMNK